MAETKTWPAVYIHRVNSRKWRLIVRHGASGYIQTYNPRQLTVRKARDLWTRATRYYHGLPIVYDDHHGGPITYTDPTTGAWRSFWPEPFPFADDPEAVVAEMFTDLGYPANSGIGFVQRGRPTNWWNIPMMGEHA